MTAYTLFVVALVAGATLGVDAAARVSCSMANNYGPGSLDVYNPACTDPAYPYCSGNECGECSSGKTQYICDCPANHACVQAVFNPVRNAAFCAPLDATKYGQACVADSDCTTQLENTGTQQFEVAITMPCKNGVCVFCNPQVEQTIICQFGPVPDGTNDRGYGSKGGEGRACSNIARVWNSNVWPLASPLPADPYYRERSLYATPSPTGAGSQSSATSTPAANPSASRTPGATASLSRGASPSGSPAAVNSNSGASSGAAVSSLLLLVTFALALVTYEISLYK
jgi:hypothetical protein